MNSTTNWRVRVIAGKSSREFGSYPTKRQAYRAALTQRDPKGHTPIVRDGHTYVVTGAR